MKINLSLLSAVAYLGLGATLHAATARSPSEIKKIENVVLYADARFHSAFPSIVRRPDGELVVAFRRAPDRRQLGDEKYTHADPNSHLVLVRSGDAGRTWTKEPQLIFAHPFGGSQDPCMVQLRDNSIVCASYGWAWMPPTALPKLPQPNTVLLGRFAFLGGHLLRSTDGGASWGQPIFPANCPGDPRVDIFGKPLAAYNRGAMCEGADGRLYWSVAMNPAGAGSRHENHLMISADEGVTWTYSCPVAQDAKVTFNETSIYETPKGDLVAFLRTAGFDDHLAIARSRDRGKSFQKWEDAGFQGHPAHAIRLPDSRVLLVYGYRHKPYGIRARVLDAECTNATAAPEIILRDDGGGGDLGYPWAAMITKNRAMVVYYFNQADGMRTIEGTILQVY
ncbi:MAG: exo-alpha-sialidase [Opitutus sp.]|nr:exo-alpha-sialidase [Opitutus sp.]